MNRTTNPTYRRHRAQVLKPDPLYCALCGEPIDKTLKYPHPMSATADHIIPVAKGGHNLGQLQPAHNRCNRAKYDTFDSTNQSSDRHTMAW